MSPEDKRSINGDYNGALAEVLTMIMQESGYNINQLACLGDSGEIDLKPLLKKPGGRKVCDLINEAARVVAWGNTSGTFSNNKEQLSVQPILDAMGNNSITQAPKKSQDPPSTNPQIIQNPPWSSDEVRGLGRYSKRNSRVKGRKQRRRWCKRGRR